jgi:UTP--glucose-1-phosphate uridylyltransferase
MKIRKAVITAAGPSQRSLPLQTLIDRDGAKSPSCASSSKKPCAPASKKSPSSFHPATKYPTRAWRAIMPAACASSRSPNRWATATPCCAPAISSGQDPFLHLVGDHLYISRTEKGCAQQLVEVAEAQACAVSAVQATRENLLPHYGAAGGQRVAGSQDLYRIDTVIEKPTPTEAEQRLVVPGLRAGHYLCFFGMHVLTPTVMDFLGPRVSLSAALAELARREQYLALERANRRYDIGVRYGLLTAQLALALSGRDRDEVLSQLVELLAEMPA